MNQTTNQSIEVAVTPWSVSEKGTAKGSATLLGNGARPASWTAASLCHQAEIAESLGFHSFWIPENHFGDHRSIPSPLTLLAAVAGRTKTLKLGSTSYLLTIRNPLQAAEEVAVLDQLSEGRVILGVGRGVQDAMFKAFDLPIKDKRKRFKTNLDIMIGAWEGRAIAQNDAGPIYLAPETVQKPYPPIWVAAFGPLALKQAGNLGMPYLASPMESLEVLANNYQQHQKVAEEAGFEKIKTVPVMRTVFVSTSSHRSAQLKQAIVASAQNRMQDESTDIDSWTIIGDKSYVSDKLSEYKERLGLTHLIARGRLPGVCEEEQISSHEDLIKVCSDINQQS